MKIFPCNTQSIQNKGNQHGKLSKLCPFYGKQRSEQWGSLLCSRFYLQPFAYYYYFTQLHSHPLFSLSVAFVLFFLRSPAHFAVTWWKGECAKGMNMTRPWQFFSFLSLLHSLFLCMRGRSVRKVKWVDLDFILFHYCFVRKWITYLIQSHPIPFFGWILLHINVILLSSRPVISSHSYHFIKHFIFCQKGNISLFPCSFNNFDKLQLS